MKKLLLLLISIGIFAFAQAQTYLIQEDFEGSTYAFTSSSTTTNSWAVTSLHAASGQKSDSAVVAVNDTTYLTSDAFSTTGSSVVYLEFDQIAKLSFYDEAIIEYSTDNGATWTKVTTGYLGTGQFNNIGSKFNSTSYPAWLPASSNAIPDSSWWQHEKFNLSSVLANTAQAKIRFVLKDGNGLGAQGNYGWLLDNIEIWKPSSQEASVAGFFMPYALASGCGLGDEVLQVHIANNGSANINGNLTVTFQREGMSPVTESVPNIIVPYDTSTYTFSNTIDLASLQDTNYQVKIWVNLLNDPNQSNDTLVDSVVSRVPLADPIVNDTTILYGTDVLLSASHADTIFWFSDPLTNNQLNVGMYYQTPILYDTTTYYVQATGALPDVKITEIVQFETGTGYTNPYPNWITGVASSDFDGVEITNLGNGPADLTGWTMNFQSVNASWGVNGSYTFPSGTILPSGGIAVIDIKTASGSTNAANFYFCAGLSGNPQSSADQGYFIKDASGTVVDAVATNSHSFAASTGVTASDWSGNIASSSGRAGVTRLVSDNDNASDWGIAGTNPTMQSFGTLNSGLTVGQGSGSGGGGLMADCPSRAVPLTVNISGIPVNDAGLTSITPDGGVSQGTPLPIQVNLKNTGIDSLKKAEIYYSINDSVYPVYNWVGALPNDSSELVTLTNFTFGSGVYRLKAWTSMPNDSVDFANHNDTTSSFVYVCLSGTFTLGGPTADFADFAALQVVLDSVGLCGPATVNILPGTYNEQLEFGNINGVSSTNTLTFQSSTGNYNDVEIKYAASSTADNYVIRFSGSSYVTVKDVMIHATGSTYAYGIEMINGATHNRVEGCYIKSEVTSSSSGIGARIYYSPIANHYNTFEGNIIEGGYYGIYHYGSSSSYQKGNQFINNEIKNWYYYGLYSYFSDSVQIVGNYIHDGQYTYNYHLYNYYPMNGYRVIGNKLICGTTASYGYGLYDYYGNYYSYNPSPSQTGLVANNMIYMRGSTYSYGMYAYYSNGTVYSHNTIKVDNAATTAYGLYQYNTASNTLGQYFRNNIYVNTSSASTSYCVYFSTPASVNYSDYNNYYTTNSNVAYYNSAQASLSALQSASGKDGNSISVDPGFLTATDLHATAVALDAAALLDTLVPYDFDGQMRDTLTPDIGADEFDLLADDAGIMSLVSPVVACPGDTMDIVVKLRNYGTDTLNSATINWTINSTTQTPLSFGGDLLPGADSNIVLGTYVFSNTLTYDMEFWTTNPNGIADLQTSNDSTVITGFKTAIPAGTYTIDTGSAADYNTISEVIQDLNTYGICGAVVFEIAPGTYTENIELTNILGSSSTNTITFRSANGDSSSVIVNWTPSGATSGGVTLIDQSYVVVEGITFNMPTTASAGRGVYLQGNSSHNQIKSCVFNQVTSTSSNVAGIYMNGSTMRYNHFMNNSFSGGYYGAYVRGTSSTDRGRGNMLDNNIFTNFYYYGVYSYYQDSVMLRGNYIENGASSVAYPRGIYCYYSDGPNELTGNIINLSVSSYGYGIYSYYNQATSNARGLIANNMISIIGGTSTSYGLYVYYNNNIDIVYNSVHIPIGGTSTRCLYTSSGTGLKVRNNIFKSVAYAYYISTTSAINSSDYNDLYTTGSYLAYWSGNRANLAALKSASSQESNSMSVDPNFLAPNDLRLITSPLDGMGQALSNVLVDFEGDVRDTLTPDMGADEFDPPAQDITLLTIENPMASNCGMTLETITVTAKNSGLDTIQGNLVLKYSLAGGANPVSETVTAIIPPQDTITYSFNTQADFTVYSDSTFDFVVWGALPQDPLAFNDSVSLAVWNGTLPPSPTLSSVQSVYGTTATLTATASGMIFWYDNPTSSLPLGTGNSFTTPVLFDTTVFYCGALGNNGCVSARVDDTVYVTGIPAGDLGISAIHVSQGCGLDSTEDVTIDVYNQGYGTITSGVTASFRVDNNAWISPESITTAIAAGDTIQYTFTTKANLYALWVDTLFDIEAAVSLTGDPYHANDTFVEDSVLSRLTPYDPVVVSPVSIPYGTSASLTATSNDTILWYSSIPDTIPVGGGSPFQTPALYSDTSYYAQAGTLGGPPQTLDVGTQSSIYTSSQTRGYHFTAPVDMTITELMVPTSVTNGGQYIQVVKFNSYPIVYPGGSAFTTLEYIQNAPFGVPQQVSISLKAGDEIGIIGACNTTGTTMANSYGPSSYSSSIDGKPVTLTRLVYQSALASGAAASGSIGMEVSASIARVEMTYRVGGAGCSSNKVPVLIDVAPPPARDAGMYSLENPGASIQSGIPVPVQVKIKNFGTDPLTSTAITYALDGVVKTTYNWTGSVAFGDTSAPITLYTDTFTGGGHTMTFYVTGANGTTQAINLNDTLKHTFSACMNGTFTIGGASADFQSFDQALTMVKTAGICGHVVFMVDSGTYTEQLEIDAIAGMDVNNTITFQSATGDSTDVILQFSASSSTSAHTIYLDGADYFRFKRMTIKAAGTSYGRAIVYQNGASHNIFEGNIIEVNGSSSSYFTPVYSSTSLDTGNVFRGNYLKNGYYGMYLRGNSTTDKERATVVENNIIEDFYYYGIYSYYTDSMIVKGNLIKDGPSSYIYPRGMYMYYGGDAFEYSNNTILLNPSSYAYGMYIYYHQNSSSQRGTIANNMLTINGGTGTNYGIYAYYSNNNNYYHNSVNMLGGGSSSRAMYFNSGTSNNFVNNVLSLDGPGYAYYVSTTGAISTSDYNDFYTTGTNFAYWNGNRANLSALQSASSKDAHSISADPEFFSYDNLHTSSVDLNDAGVYAYITHDIDGDLRSTTAPDMGADEYDPPQWDAGIINLDAPVSPLQVGSNPVKVTLRNFGLDTLTTVSIGWSVNGNTQNAQSWTGSLITGDTIMNIGLGSFNAVAGANIIKAWTSMPNNHNDQLNINDTTEVTLIGCNGPLGGTYTIGGATADFPDFTSAVDAMTFCGINDTVVFLVNSGTYTEQIKINPIIGASATSYVRFTSVTGDSTDVTLTYVPTSGENYVIYLDGADYIHFDHMTISGTGTSGYAVKMGGGANHNVFESNIISMPYSTSSAVSALRSEGDQDNYNVFKYNEFSGGYYCFYWRGVSTSSFDKGTQLIGNSFNDFYYYGVYFYYQDSLIFNNNYVNEGSTTTYGYYPAYFYYCDNYLEIANNFFDLSPSSYSYGLRVYYCDANANTHGRIYNNVIAINTSGTGTSYGMYIYSSTNMDMMFNSVNIQGGGTSTRAAYVYSGSGHSFVNNNLVCNNGYTLYTNGSISYSDHNNYYKSLSDIGVYWNTNQTTLASLQASNMMDSNSVQEDPGFYSANDLHVTNPVLANAGTPFGNVTHDFEGDVRSAVSPSIGADEFASLQWDVAAYRIDQPTMAYAAVTTQQTVEGVYRNFGSDTITSLTLGYIYGSNNAVTQTWNDTLLPGGTLSFTFTQPFTVQSGSKSLCLYAVLANDMDTSNDTICMSFTGMPLFSLTYMDDFDGPVNYWAQEGNVWELGSPAQTTLNAPYTAPNAWMTKLNADYPASTTAYLYSPFFNVSNVTSATLKFRHKFKMVSGDAATVQYSTDGGQTWILLGVNGTPNGTNWYNVGGATGHHWSGTQNTWLLSTYDLTNEISTVSTPIQFRFTLTTNSSGNDEGWLIDDFSIELPPIPNDGGVIALRPDSSIINSSVVVKATVENFGTDTLKVIPMRYTVDGGNPVQETWNLSAPFLAPGDTMTYNFNTTFIAPNTAYDLCAYTEIPGDIYSNNDELCKNVKVIAAPLDAAVKAIVQPGDTTAPFTPTTVTVRIINYGTQPLSTVDVQYDINGLNPKTETWSGGPLAMGDSADYTFQTTYVSPVGGDYQLCARTLLSGDADPTNDETCKTVTPWVGMEEEASNGMKLWQNMPNPASDVTQIRYEIPTAGVVSFELVDIVGNTLMSTQEKKIAGVHTIELKAADLANGVYYYSVVLDGVRLTKQMIINK